MAPYTSQRLRGKLRIYYSFVVLSMASMFLAHGGYLLKQYLSSPILTEIKYGNIDFTYPDITLCPNAPFTDQDAPPGSKLRSILNTTENFWLDTNQVNFGSPRAHQKRSVLSTFHKLSEKIGKKPYQHVLECQVKNQECLENFIITQHPTYYRCFTLRIKTKPPVPAGPTNGIRLILHRGKTNATPLLLVAEEEASLLQSVSTPEALEKKDGFFIAFHEKGTFPNFPVQSLPNGLSLRFGYSVRIGLEQTHHEAVSLKGRECIDGQLAAQIELLRLDQLSQSNARPNEVEQKKAKFAYTRQACVATHRQRLTYQTCRCFSEEYGIPFSMRDIGEVWCHDLETSTTNIIRIGETLECMERIANMTDDEIIENPGYSVIKFISDLGGVSGLYVGITMYTLAEVIDLVTQFMCVYIPYFWSATKLEVLKKKNLAARIERRLATQAITEDPN
ncbi:unnamed protein product [Dicrocoelium dendriticum]|nr:unnamed protein product [Dicrocoelium dendriticum]